MLLSTTKSHTFFPPSLGPLSLLCDWTSALNGYLAASDNYDMAMSRIIVQLPRLIDVNTDFPTCFKCSKPRNEVFAVLAEMNAKLDTIHDQQKKDKTFMIKSLVLPTLKITETAISTQHRTNLPLPAENFNDLNLFLATEENRIRCSVYLKETVSVRQGTLTIAPVIKNLLSDEAFVHGEWSLDSEQCLSDMSKKFMCATIATLADEKDKYTDTMISRALYKEMWTRKVKICGSVNSF